MPTDQPEGFADNWAYLRMELRWLDQILMLAVARQRKDNQDVERIAQSKADRATSFWWKGIIAVEGHPVYDEHRQPTQSGAKVSYQQQLETQIQVSRQRDVILALPALRDRLKLTQFEKNLVLMSLAPEVNRRYARLYRYLQGDDASVKTDLPTVDLALRLLCRNDTEWRSARNRLASNSPLIHHDLLRLLPCATDNLLNRPLKLTESLINYLLADQPTEQDLETLLYPSTPPTRQPILHRTLMGVDWSDVILPESLLTSLRFLGQRVQGQTYAEEVWGYQAHHSTAYGTIALLVGASGTGKTIAAGAIAHSLKTALANVDLRYVDPEDYAQLLQEMLAKAPTVLLLKSAQLWLGRSAFISPMQIHRFFEARRNIPGITLLSVHQQASVQVQWQRSVDQILKFPMPNPEDRLRLWQRAFPSEVPLDTDTIDWQALSTQLSLSGGEIVAIAHDAVLCAAATEAPKLEMNHLLQALGQRGKTLKIQTGARRSTKSRSRRTQSSSK
ncbi:MAG: hypothetical protein HC865_18865 [Cyanobacteria bacterium RU_5_0]|nr:hypothetical protein [Cyanobacteria bacterium RU_5_0]